jgi:general stress protein YciG
MASKRAKGGQATKRRYGIAFCLMCHRPLDTPYFAELGSKGGQTVFQQRGREWMSQIGRLGGRHKRRGSEDDRQSPAAS